MTACDRCNCFAGTLKSLDGFTLLCRDCQQDVERQKKNLIHHPPCVKNSILPVWSYLMKNAVPFRVFWEGDQCALVFYGCGQLLDVVPLLQSWFQVAQDKVPEGIVDFGCPTEDCDIDGLPLETSFSVYRLEKSMISVEEYGCWVKVQIWV